MKRKDILIIAIILVLITFGTVFAIYYVVNDGDIFKTVVEEKEYHSNGWRTSIVDKIKDDVPIPVGFTYVEGKKSAGIIIENDTTKEKYMWIPYVEAEEIDYEKYSSLGLDVATYETRENIEKYDGFYVALDERNFDERFDEYLKENTGSFDEYYKLKKEGYEKYNELYKSATGEDLDLSIVITEEDIVNSDSKGISTEVHTMTIEEIAIFENFKQEIGKEIAVKDLKTLTVLGALSVNTKDVDEKIATKVEDANGDVAYVPRGFEHVEGTKVETGFKIINTENLAFVWIPVEDISKVEEEFLANAKKANLSESIINSYKSYKDDESSEEYKELIESIEKYGGFYISEAELGYDENGNVINRFRKMYEKGGKGTGYNYVTNGDYFRNVDPGNYAAKGTALREKQSSYKLTYDNAVKTAKELYNDSEVAVSHLTYGIEYDAVVNYLIKTGVIELKEAFKDSTSKGKYRELNGKKSLWEKEYYLNGIYGLAGNLEEITGEKDGENIILRGGSWNTNGESKPLASKVSVKENQIDIGKDADGNDKTIGEVGFRACLYIKTEYEENTELETKKEKAFQELKDYIDSLSIKLGDKEYFNNTYNETIGKYELEALNSITEYIEERLEKETSSTSFNKIIQYGKDEVDKIKNNMQTVLTYPSGYIGIIGYTEGELEDECSEIRENAVKEMESLTWKDGVVTNEDGDETSYEEIKDNTIDQILKIRDDYKEEKIDEYIRSVENVEGEAKDLQDQIISKLKNIHDLNNYIEYCKQYRQELEDFVKNGPKEKDYNYVALGDSIAYGYLVGKEERYGNLLEDDIKASDYNTDYINLAVTGWKTEDLLNAVSNKNYSEVGRKHTDYANASYSLYYDSIKEADLITMSIGSNNLLKVLTTQLSEILELEGEELTAENIKNKIKEFSQNKITLAAKLIELTSMVKNLESDLDDGVNAYKQKWPELLKQIKAINGNAQIIVTEFYNPYSDLTGIPVSTNNASNFADFVGYYIDKLNTILYDESNNETEYKIAKIHDNYCKGSGLTNVDIDVNAVNGLLTSGFTNDIEKILGNTVKLDIDPHPNKAGHKVIFTKIKEVFKLTK